MLRRRCCIAIKTRYLVGERYKNNQNRYYTIKSFTDNNRRRNIVFDSGYECCALISQLNSGKVKDLCAPTYYGVASSGMKNASQHFLFNRWINMIGRCYNKKHSGYKSYGANGVVVSKELLNFKTYVDIVQQLPNYKFLVDSPQEWDIDKDYKSNGVKIYSKDTLCIMKKKKNIELENQSKKVKIQQFTLENNLLNTYESIHCAESATGIHRGNIAKVIRGKAKTAGGFIWRKYYDTEF